MSERTFPLPLNADIPSAADLEAPVSPLFIDLNWDAYFDEFKKQHGEPVRWRNRLLFADGWTYNLRSKVGPEWPPPTEPGALHEYRTCYWLTRLSLVQTEFNVLADLIQGIKQLQRQYSLPLQHTVIVRSGSSDPNDSMLQSSQRLVRDLDIQELEQGRLAWLQEDIAYCQEQLGQLECWVPGKRLRSHAEVS